MLGIALVFHRIWEKLRISPGSVVVVASLALSLGTYKNAYAGVVIGVVEAVCGGSDGLILRRDGLSIKDAARLLSDIRAGDEIFIVSKHGCMVILLANGKRMVLAKTEDAMHVGVIDEESKRIYGQGYVIPNNIVPDERWFLSNVLGIFASMVDRQFDYTRQASIMATRGDEPLDLPLLWADDNFVVEGERPLMVSWVGGEAPFAVEMAPEGGEALVVQDGVGGQVSEPVVVDLAPGPWTVSVVDAAGEAVDGVFTVVPASEVPQAPADEGLEAMPDVLRESAEAAWLAEQDDGNWMYEAYLRAGALAPAFVPAGYLERYLASGALWQ